MTFLLPPGIKGLKPFHDVLGKKIILKNMLNKIFCVLYRNIYVHIYIYVYMYIYAYMHTSIYIFIGGGERGGRGYFKNLDKEGSH